MTTLSGSHDDSVLLTLPAHKASRPFARRVAGAALPTAVGLFATAMLLALLGALSPGALSPGALPVSAAGSTRYVSPAGNDTANDCSTIGTPCQSVQQALEMAGDGDRIEVAQGIYTSTSGTVAAVTHTVTLQGGWDGAFTQNNPASHPTVLDGQGLQPVMVISPSTTLLGGQISPTVEAFVITHGRGITDGCPIGLTGFPTPECGGGIKSFNADPLILNNVISNNVGGNNSDEGDGGGIFIDGSGAAAIISGNVIISNVANVSGQGFGGGVMLFNGVATIQGNQIHQNQDSLTSRGQGAGITLAFSPGLVSLIGNDIRDNRSSFRGGGLWANGANSSLVISGNTILSNTALVQGGALLINGGVATLISYNTIAYNQVISNTAGRGGGIRISSDDAGVTITHNDIYSNVSAWGGGSGIDLAGSGLVDGNSLHQNQNGQWGAALVLSGTASPMTATNNVVAGNLGAGIEAIDFGLSVSLVNNTVVGNRNAGGGAPGTGLLVTFDTPPGAGITATVVNNLLVSGLACGLSLHNPPAVRSHHNDVWTNATDYCETASSAGNLSVDPRFVNAAAGNYHLSGVSPAINAGSNAEAPARDKDGVSRPQGLIADIGAYEFIFGHEMYLPVVSRQ